MNDEQFPPIEWDADGYPTEASLAELKLSTAAGTVKAALYLREELAKCAEACCASYAEEPARSIVGKPVLHLHFSTGGWSGAEDLIETMLDKFWIEVMHIQWRRGGHYIFEVPAA